MGFLRKYWWALSLVIGVGLSALMISRVVAGEYELERRAILNDFRVASSSIEKLDAFAEATTRRIENGRLDARNTDIVRFLAARARYASARAKLDAALKGDDPRPQVYDDVYDAFARRLEDPGLYLHSSGVSAFSADDARDLDAAGAGPLDRARLARELEDDCRQLGRRLANIGDPLGAWAYLRTLAEGVTHGEVKVAPLAQRVRDARDTVLAQYVRWSAAPEEGGAACLAAQAECEKLWADFAAEARQAAAVAAQARVFWRRHEAQISGRESRLIEDIAAIEGGKLTPDEERRRLARHFSGEELEAALRLNEAQRSGRLTERRAAFVRDVARRKSQLESVQAFERMCEGLAGPQATPSVAQTAALLENCNGLRGRLVESPGVAAAARMALMADQYVLAADLLRRLGREEEPRRLLADVGEGLASLVAATGYVPSPARRLNLPPGLTGAGPAIELAMLEEAAADTADAATRASSPGQKALLEFESAWLKRTRQAVLDGAFEHARGKQREFAAAIRKLAGPQRPAADSVDPSTGVRMLTVAEDDLRQKRDEALRAIEPFARLPEPDVAARARLIGAGVLIDDLRYRYEYCYWLDPRGLSAFRREVESVEGARARLNLGPPADIRRRAAQWLAELESRVSFARDPQTWVAVRLRKGQLMELTPELRPGVRPRLATGDFAGAVRDIYLPLLSSADVEAGAGLDAATGNEVLPLAEFLAAYSRKLEMILDYLPPTSHGGDPSTGSGQADLAEIEAVLKCIGNPADHAAMLKAAARLAPDPQSARTAARVYRRCAGLEQARASRLPRALAPAAEEAARRHFERAARTLVESSPQNDDWAQAGADFLRAARYAEALIALKRYFDADNLVDRRDGTVTMYDAARAMGEAFEAVEAYGGAEPDPTPGRMQGAIDCYLWSAREARAVLARSGELPAPALETFIALARARYRCGLAEGRPEQFRAAIDELNAHIIKAEIFRTPPADLDSSGAWRDAQYYRGLCALEFARAERAADAIGAEFENWLSLAFLSFDDVVQRFNDQRSATTRDAQYRAAHCEWLRAAWHAQPLSRAGVEPLRRAALRLDALIEEIPAGDELLLPAMTLRGDVLELLGRRMFEQFAADPALDPAEARKTQQAALAIYEKVEQLDPHAWQNAWALGQRVQILRNLGRYAQSELDRARELLANATLVLDRIPDAQWKLAPRGQNRAYWASYFEWAAK
ncbi:MAG: hypothetical protein IT462_12590 [Planctomycetes bacterium]|nr:hypothetical protein [Planctomycetota bacterium]